MNLGHEVHVFTAEKYQDKHAPKREEIEGMVVHRFPFKLDLSYRLKIWDGLEKALLNEGKFDIIHSYDYAQSHTRTALKAAKKQNTPFVITIFDIHSMIPRPIYKQMPLRLFEKFFAKGLLGSADRVLVRAPPLVDSLKKLGVPERNIVVTPSGINEDSLNTFDRGSFLTEYGIAGSPIILFLGRLNPLKGPQHILNIAPGILRVFPEAAFVFIGPDQSGYLEKLKLMAKSQKIENSVHFPGPIYDFNKKMQAYSSCDVFVLPTTYEGTSQAIFEAMSQGRPVISTNVGGIPFQIQNEKEGFLVPYGDDKALEDAIFRVLRDRALSQNLGQNAKNRVKSLTYPELASDLLKIYESIIDSQKKDVVPSV